MGGKLCLRAYCKGACAGVRWGWRLQKYSPYSAGAKDAPVDRNAQIDDRSISLPLRWNLELGKALFQKPTSPAPGTRRLVP